MLISEIGLRALAGKKRIAPAHRKYDSLWDRSLKKSGGGRPLRSPYEDPVRRKSVIARPKEIWNTDIAEHPTRTGKRIARFSLVFFPGACRDELLPVKLGLRWF